MRKKARKRTTNSIQKKIKQRFQKLLKWKKSFKLSENRKDNFFVYGGFFVLALILWNLLVPGQCLSDATKSCWLPLGDTFVKGHEGVHYLLRSIFFHEAISGGDWLPRWSTEMNSFWGYPFFLFYGSGSFYLAEIFRFILPTDDVAIIWNIMTATTFLLSGMGMYLFLRLYTEKIPAFCGALVFVFFPYHLAEIFMRGDVGESIAGYTWIPFAAYFAVRFIREQRVEWGVLGAIFLSAVIFTHTLSGLIWVPTFGLMVLFLAWSEKAPARVYYGIIGAGVLAAFLAAFYAFPAMLENSKTYAEERLFNSPKIPTLHQVPEFLSLKYDFLTFFQAPYDYIEVAPLTIGYVLLFLVALTFFFSKNMSPKSRSLLRFWVIVFALCGALISCKFLNWVWDREHFPILYMLQFPWRLGMLMAFGAAVFVAILAQTLLPAGAIKRPYSRTLLVGFFVVIIWIGAYPYLKYTTWGNKPINPNDNKNYLQSYFGVGDLYKIASPEISPAYNSTLDNDYAPRTVPITFDEARKTNRPAEYRVLYGQFPDQLTYKFIEKNGAEFNFEVNNNQAQSIWMEHYFFDGWTARFNGKKLPTTHNHDGLISFETPRGSGHLQVKLEPNMIRYVAEKLSLFAFILSLLILIFKKPINQVFSGQKKLEDLWPQKTRKKKQRNTRKKTIKKSPRKTVAKTVQRKTTSKPATKKPATRSQTTTKSQTSSKKVTKKTPTKTVAKKTTRKTTTKKKIT